METKYKEVRDGSRLLHSIVTINICGHEIILEVCYTVSINNYLLIQHL